VQDRAYQLQVGFQTGSPNLLPALGVSILAGRPLAQPDSAGVPVPTVITRSLADRLWPDGGALGKTFSMPQLRGTWFCSDAAVADELFCLACMPSV
jgi:hypothetical protein